MKSSENRLQEQTDVIAALKEEMDKLKQSSDEDKEVNKIKLDITLS